MAAAPLTATERRALEAVCACLVPHTPAAALAEAAAERLATLETEQVAQVRRALRLMERRMGAWAVLGRPVRVSALPAAECARLLACMEVSPVAARRTLLQGLRRLVMVAHYGRPAVQRAIGHRGPLHARGPEVEWEGPLPGPEGSVGPVRQGAWAAVPGAGAPPGEPAPPGLVQGHQLPDGTRVRAGVCVVGTGAGGAVVAARLAEAGHQVVLLEEGGYWTAADFVEDDAVMIPRLYADAGARATEDLAVSLLQGRTVGGGTTVNWMIMLRTPDRVLDEWGREHGLEGMGPAEMQGVFARVEREVHARQVPDPAHSPNNRLLLEAAGALGWSAHAATINARGCVRAGSCGLGCRFGARQGALATYLPRALAAGAVLYSDARVERVTVRERGGRAPLKQVEAVVLDRATGRPRGRLVVEAPLVVLAAGAVGTPGILQRSGMGGGAVGRFLRLHPTSSVVGVYPHEVYASAGIPLSAVCDQLLDLDGRGYGCWIECPPLHPTLMAAAIPGMGAAHHRVMLRYRDLASFIVLVRDGAGPGSSGEVRVDRRGRARVRYRLDTVDARHLAAGLTAAARLHLAAGAREVRTLHAAGRPLHTEAELGWIGQQRYAPNRLALFSAHLNGTCRLGADPRTSGCDPDGQRHGVPGLYVADGSLLPTAPGVNPQETIMAVASVLAERMAASHPAR